jgi:hypothetical protein
MSETETRLRAELRAAAEITPDYLEAKVAEAHRLRAETLSAMMRALFLRRGPREACARAREA